MDENLEIPNALPKAVPVVDGAEDEESSGEEDVPDWTKFASAADSNRNVIPKRGDKEFEPAPGGPTNLQSYALNRSRNAMFDALRVERGTSSKSISYGIWLPSFSLVEVTNARGNSFVTLGHQWTPSGTEPRLSKTGGTSKATAKKLCLLPEEALYLIERGSMFCWRELEQISAVESQELPGAPMSVQQAFAEMIGKQNLTLERYQVFAYLKRLGYTVTRAEAPAKSPLYPMPPQISKFSLLTLLRNHLTSWTSKWRSWMSRLALRLWQPFRFGWLACRSYPSIFSKLRIISSDQSSMVGQAKPVLRGTSSFASDVQPQASSAYKIFFNAWKPSTPWRKTGVPPPDFQIIVVNANTTLLPTFPEFASVFHDLPGQPLPLPRKRLKPGRPAEMASSPSKGRQPHSLYSRLKRLLGLAPKPQQSKPNLFLNLKAGNKSMIIASVDGGSISFIRFSEGNFVDWPAF